MCICPHTYKKVSVYIFIYIHTQCKCTNIMCNFLLTAYYMPQTMLSVLIVLTPLAK